jgi:hypothetical protein
MAKRKRKCLEAAKKSAKIEENWLSSAWRGFAGGGSRRWRNEAAGEIKWRQAACGGNEGVKMKENVWHHRLSSYSGEKQLEEERKKYQRKQRIEISSAKSMAAK